MVFSEGLPHTLQMPFEDLGRGACTSGEFTPISFASARGWPRILSALGALEGHLYYIAIGYEYISQDDTNGAQVDG
jgi:hypothetical protein